MESRSARILELDELEQVEAIAQRYLDTFGSLPLNISHWDPSREFSARLRPLLDLGIDSDPVNYIYSYDCKTSEILERLGFDPATKGCLITPSGTVSMLCVANWITARRDSFQILRPLYFPILHQAARVSLSASASSMVRHAGEYALPREAIQKGGDLTWLTSPVYCAGVLLGGDDRAWLNEYLAGGRALIVDECLAPAGRELARHIGHHAGFLGIYSPHKSVCINAFKFSVVVFDRSEQVFFDQWADVLYGGLPASTRIALRHFLSPNFQDYDAAFREAIRGSLATVKELARGCPSGEFDVDPVGHLVTFYLPRLSADLGTDDEFLWAMARETAALLIPGTRNHFDKNYGFCFRINLALDGPQFRGALGRLFRFLQRS